MSKILATSSSAGVEISSKIQVVKANAPVIVEGTFSFETSTGGHTCKTITGPFDAQKTYVIEIWCDKQELGPLMPSAPGNGVFRMTCGCGDILSEKTETIANPGGGAGTTLNNSAEERNQQLTPGRGPRIANNNLIIGTGTSSAPPYYIAGVTYHYRVYMADFKGGEII